MALALVLLALAVAVLASFYVAQRSLIYFPQVTRADAAGTDFALERGDATLRGWIVHAGADGAPILYFGGNAEAVEGNRDAFARLFPGRSVYLPAYRGYGASDGKPSHDAILADALALHDFIAARHPGQPVSVIGRSLGSGVASHLASQRPIAKLALVTPFDSLADVGAAHYPWLPVRWLLRERYDSVAALRDYSGPVLVIRAGRDAVVPPANTDRFVASLPRGTRVVALPEADHDLVGEEIAYGKALSDFLR